MQFSDQTTTSNLYIFRQNFSTHWPTIIGIHPHLTVRRFTVSSWTALRSYWCKTGGNSLVGCGSEMRLDLTGSYINCTGVALELHFNTCYAFDCVAAESSPLVVSFVGFCSFDFSLFSSLVSIWSSYISLFCWWLLWSSAKDITRMVVLLRTCKAL